MYDRLRSWLPVAQEYGNARRDYVYLNGEPVAMKVYGDTDAWYWFLNDHLGTPQVLVNAAGLIVWEAGYMPFGEARIVTATIENNLRFPGQYFDAETGLHYNFHRYYNPATGRYITADPIGLAGGINLYAYVNGNPVNWVDPRGLDFSEGLINGLWGLIAGTAIAGVVVLSAPVSVATAFLVIGSAAGGFSTGVTMYESATQTKWVTGERLSQDEVGTRQGQLVIDAVTLGLVGTWGMKGMKNDKAFLHLSPKNRWKYEMGSLPVSDRRFSQVCDIPPQDRDIKWSEYNPVVLGKTVSEGPTPLARLPLLPGMLGSNQ